MASWIWMNIPAMVLAFALTVGIPTRMVLKNRVKAVASPAVPVAAADSARHERVDELVAV